MNTSSDAAEQIVRISLDGFQVVAKITGSGAKDIAALLYAIMKDKTKTSGKTNLTNMLKSGKELRIFSVKQSEFNKFTNEAKRYGILYSALINKRNISDDGVIDIMVRAEDAAKINRIVDRFKLSSYDETTIRSELDKAKIMKKEDDSLNLKFSKAKKSLLLESSSKMQENSEQNSKNKNKQSVKEKLDKAKEEVKIREKTRSKFGLKLNKNTKAKKFMEKNR